MKSIFIHIWDPRTINPIVFDDSMTFPRAKPQGLHFCCLTSNEWIGYTVMLYRQPFFSSAIVRSKFKAFQYFDL